MSTAPVPAKPRHLLLAALGGAVVGALLIFLVARPSVVPAVRAEAAQQDGAATQKTARAPAGFIVVTCFPGLPAETVAETITRHVERWLGELPDVAASESRSITGVSMVKFTLRPNADMALVLAQANARILACLPELPPNCPPPLVQLGDPGSEPVVGLVVLDSAVHAEAALRDSARTALRPRLARLPGVRAPVVLGGKERQIVFYLDQTKMRARGLSVAQVARALESRRETAPLGFVRIGLREYLLEAAYPTDVRQALNAVRIPEGDGMTTLLQDVGVPQDANAPQQSLVRLNGRRMVCVPLFRRGPEATQAAVTKAVLQLEKELPKDTRLFFLAWDDENSGARDLTLFLRTPSGLQLPVTEDRVAAVERVLQKAIPTKDREWILSEVGVRADASALLTQNAGPQDATLRIRLEHGSSLSAPKYAARLRELFAKDAAFADLQVRFRVGPVPFTALDRSTLADLAVEVSGGTSGQRQEAARLVRDRVGRVPGTSAVAVWQRADAPSLRIDVDPAKALALGLTPAEVLRQAASVLNGAPASHLWVRDKAGGRHAVSVQYPEAMVKRIEDVLNVPILQTKPMGPIPLKDVARLRHALTRVEVSHRNGSAVLDVLINADSGPATVDAVERAIDLKLPPGVALRVRRLTRGGGP